LAVPRKGTVTCWRRTDGVCARVSASNRRSAFLQGCHGARFPPGANSSQEGRSERLGYLSRVGSRLHATRLQSACNPGHTSTPGKRGRYIAQRQGIGKGHVTAPLSARARPRPSWHRTRRSRPERSGVRRESADLRECAFRQSISTGCSRAGLFITGSGTRMRGCKLLIWRALQDSNLRPPGS